MPVQHCPIRKPAWCTVVAFRYSGWRPPVTRYYEDASLSRIFRVIKSNAASVGGKSRTERPLGKICQAQNLPAVCASAPQHPIVERYIRHPLLIRRIGERQNGRPAKPTHESLLGGVILHQCTIFLVYRQKESLPVAARHRRSQGKRAHENL